MSDERKMTSPPRQEPEVPRVEPGSDDHWLVRPSTIRMLWIVSTIVLAATVVPDFFIDPYDHFGIDGTFGFYAWYGFATCVAMVVGAKALSLLFLKRSDGYYFDDEGAEDDD